MLIHMLSIYTHISIFASQGFLICFVFRSNEYQKFLASKDDCSKFVGNDALHALTKSANTLRIQLTTFNGSTVQAEYSNLSVSDESANYAMTYGKYVKGSAGKLH